MWGQRKEGASLGWAEMRSDSLLPMLTQLRSKMPRPGRHQTLGTNHLPQLVPRRFPSHSRTHWASLQSRLSASGSPFWLPQAEPGERLPQERSSPFHCLPLPQPPACPGLPLPCLQEAVTRGGTRTVCWEACAHLGGFPVTSQVLSVAWMPL